MSPAFSRRGFLGAAAWLPVGALLPGQVSADPPPAFPAGITLYRQAYRNWAGEIRTDDLWTCAPRTPADVVLLANWAHGQGFTLRARGFRHGWAPLTVTADTTGADRVVLVDTTEHLTAMGASPETSVAEVPGLPVPGMTVVLDARADRRTPLPVSDQSDRRNTMYASSTAPVAPGRDTRLEALAAACPGDVHGPGTPEYDAHRVPWNVAVDQQPAAVATPVTAEQVAAVVTAALRLGYRVAPQGTGHGAAPGRGGPARRGRTGAGRPSRAARFRAASLYRSASSASDRR